jgi:hypothetical protein
MATDAPRAITHWAVIIGIDYYPGHKDKCLEGCVYDAQDASHYMKDALGESSNVEILTASTPSVHGGPPMEEEQVWPTYENVKSHLDRIINDAECGDRVYIHYSGHGTQVLSRDGRPECALVLLECNGRQTRCLRSGLLVRKLDEMVEKGLLVTLVLDCCFSGGIIRNSNGSDFDVRFLGYDTTVNSGASPKLDAKFSEPSSTFRDASLENNGWLVNPNGYMILAACAPEELAFEIKIRDRRRGTFTYFLLHALRVLLVNGIDITHCSVHEHLSTSLYAHWPRQTPMRYGKMGFTLFGDSLLAPENSSVPIYKDKDGHLHLRAGEVHGVFERDEYVAYDTERLERVNDRCVGGVVNIRVTAVKTFESNVEELDQSSVGQIETGWKAKLLTSLSPCLIRIGLVPSVSRSSQSTLMTGRHGYMHLVAMKEPGEDWPGESTMYNVVLNKENEYEVVDAFLEKVYPIPSIPCSWDRASDVLMNVLQHIAEFKYFERVENRIPCEDFHNSFSIDLESPPGHSNTINIKHGDKWTATLKNRSDKQLYVGIFDFRPSWEVKPLISDSGFRIIPPKKNNVDGAWRISLKMAVPTELQEKGESECEDIIKIFITSRATHFRASLSSLFELTSRKHDTIRSGDNLSNFLSKLTGDIRGQSGDKWATRSFRIRTSIQ